MLSFQLDSLIQAALMEDAPAGDLSARFFAEPTQLQACLIARQAGVVSGLAAWARTFACVDQAIEVHIHVAEGTAFRAGDRLAQVKGEARSILQAERVALNIIQRMSAIATHTARYVAAVAHTPVRITDTRKTTPGLRSLERAAIRAGGGCNHRSSLSDVVMIKDNHIAALGAARPSALTAALRRLRQQIPHTACVEVEIDHLDQLDAVLAADVDIVMLDNFSLDDLRTAVARINRRAVIEVSGGMTLDRVAAVAETGIDVISVGALTYGVPAIDFGLDVVD